jgi:hypothetical protein
VPHRLPPHKAQRTHTEKDEDTEPGFLPVEPDQGPVTPALPEDPENDQAVEPPS